MTGFLALLFLTVLLVLALERQHRRSDERLLRRLRGWDGGRAWWPEGPRR